MSYNSRCMNSIAPARHCVDCEDLMEEDDEDRWYEEHIVTDPEILVGKPVVRGRRIPVYLVLAHLTTDFDLNTLFEDYPHLTLKAVKACLLYAAERVSHPIAKAETR